VQSDAPLLVLLLFEVYLLFLSFSYNPALSNKHSRNMKQELPAFAKFGITILSIVLLVPLAPSTSSAASASPSACFFAPDTTGPVLVCPSDTVLFLAKGACDAEYVYEVFAFDGTDTLPAVQEDGLPSGSRFPLGLTLNLFTASDAAGNTAACEFTVLVQPDTLPLVCPQQTTIFLGPHCWAVPDVEELLKDGYYTCPDKIGVMLLLPSGQEPAFFDHSHLGENFLMIVRDSLLEEECQILVDNVRDTVPPELTCVNIQVPCLVPAQHLAPGFLRDSLGIAEGYPAITEACPGEVQILFTDVRQDYPCDSVGLAGRLRRFWTVSDAHGNFATCIQVIELVRAVDGVQLPTDKTVSCTASLSPDSLGWPYFVVGQRSYPLQPMVCGLETSYTQQAQPLCGGSYLLTRVWEVRDGCRDNDPDVTSFVGEQAINVLDNQGPTVRCQPIVGTTLQEAGCSGTIDLPDFVVTDACSPVVRAVLQWNSTDSLEAELTDFIGNDTLRLDTLAVFGELSDLDVGPLPMTLTLYDACGNVSTCTFNLDVRDQQPPVALCEPVVVVYLDSTGRGLAPAQAFDGGSTDDCRLVNLKVRRPTPPDCDTLLHPWDDFLRVCCTDASTDLIAVLRVYDAVVPTGPVPDSTGGVHYTECEARVQVISNALPFCEAPADVTVDCHEFDPTLLAYGEATFSCGPDSTAAWLDTTAFHWSCGAGKLRRIFQVFDASGNSSECIQEITGLPNFHFFVRFPDDLDLSECASVGSFGEPVILSEGCEEIVVELLEEKRPAAPEACYYLERTWTVYNRCLYKAGQPLVTIPNPQPHPIANHPDNLPGPTVSASGSLDPWTPTVVSVEPGQTPTDYSIFWSSDVGGYRYTQIVRINDTEFPTLDCSPDTLAFNDVTNGDTTFWAVRGLDLCEADVHLSLKTWDACSGSDIEVSYLLFIDVNGDNSPETVLSDQLAPDLPPGVVMYNNINNPNHSGGTALTFDRRDIPDLQKYRFDMEFFESGDTLYVEVVWRAPGQTTHVPPKLPRGTHRIRWIVDDGCGNAVSCERAIRVGPLLASCNPPAVSLMGSLRTEQGKGIPNIPMEVTGVSPLQEPFTYYPITDQDGKYTFEVPAGSIYGVRPIFFNNDYPNGVSTLDLLLINRHILGVEALSSPYRIIAGDANSSRSVTTFDIVELRRLILGIYTELPTSPSWRSISAQYQFPNPSQPFNSPIDTIILSDMPSLDFIGIKVGDVNNSVKLNLKNAPAEDRQIWYWDVENRPLSAGEEVVITLIGESAVAGLQGTLELSNMKLLEVLPGHGFSPGYYAVLADSQRLTFSWVQGGIPTLSIRVRALSPGLLSDNLALSDSITPSEAYAFDFKTILYPKLRFSSVTTSVDHAPAHSNTVILFSQPNPFGSQTWVHAYLPKDALTTLRLQDVTGRLVWEKTTWLSAGMHSILLEASILGDARGLLYLSLETPYERAVHRLVRF